MKNKTKKNKLVILFIVLDVMACIFLFCTYGPISYFRDLLITTAMTTKSHHYLARTLYSDNLINKVLSQNYTQEVNENTNIGDIDLDSIVETDKYESEYEKQILEHDKDQVYKIIELEGTGYKGFMAVVYDPSKIELVTSKYLSNRGQMLKEMSIEYDSLVSINAGGFADGGGTGNGGTPTGTVIKDSKIVYQGVDTGWGGGLAGFTKDNILVLTKESATKAIASGLEDAVEFGPFLIVNGKRSITKGNGGWGVAPRTALAQRKDGIVLFIVIDGRQPGYSVGISMAGLTDLLVQYKAYNAVNLDGGASSSIVEKGVTISKPCAYSSTGERWIPNAWIVK